MTSQIPAKRMPGIPGKDYDPALRKVEDRYFKLVSVGIAASLLLYAVSAVLYVAINNCPAQLPHATLNVMRRSIDTAGRNWPALVVIFIPLFYRQIRRAMENLQGKMSIGIQDSGEKYSSGSRIEEQATTSSEDTLVAGEEENE